MLAVIWAIDSSEGAQLRALHLAEHLAFIETQMAIIRIAGPWLNDAGAMIGSMFVIEAESLPAARAWIAADPYTRANVWRRIDVHGYRAAAGTWVGGRNW